MEAWNDGGVRRACRRGSNGVIELLRRVAGVVRGGAEVLANERPAHGGPKW